MGYKKSIYDIAMECTIAIYGSLNIDKGLKIQVLNFIVKKIKEGYCCDDFYRCFNKNTISNNSIESFDTFEKKLNKSSKHINLLNPNKIYIHNELIIVNAPPKKRFDYDSGEIEYIEEDYFFENVASYTVNDLYNYVSKQDVYSIACKDKQRAIGGFNYLIKSFEIEELLFMIDCGEKLFFCDIVKEIPNILDIKKFYKDAIVNLNSKKTALKQAGFFKITPKKRNG